MCGTINPFNVRGVPCALKPHLNSGTRRKAIGSLSQHGCQSSFLDWVKNFRRTASDVDEEELLMCPMLWCRNTFKDVDTTVHHVFRCSRLSNGWYWCPYCKRPERFLECDKGCDNVTKPRLQKRDTKLAVIFFRWLGRRHSPKKLVEAPRSAESEDTTRDERIRRGSCKGEPGKGRQIIGLYTKKPDRCLSNASQGSSRDVQKSKTRADAAHAGWVHEKAKCPGGLPPPLSEIAGTPVYMSERSELPSSPSWHALHSELSTPDPVYCTPELRDRVSFNVPEGHIVTSPTTLHDLQADSSHGSTRQGADILGSNDSTKFARLSDEHTAYSPFELCFEGNGDYQSSTPYLLHDDPAPQTAAPGTLSPSPSPISPLCNAQPLSSRVSALVSPMSNVGPLTALTQQVQGISTIANAEDGINAWRSHSSTLPPKETHSQGRFAKLRANTLPASDPARYQWYPSSQSGQIPVQIQDLGAEANHGRAPRLGGSPAQIRTQVEELRGLVCIINHEWMRRLVSSPELYLRCSSLSTRTLFAEGIDTLKTWFCGKIERSFEEVFAFMHIAFAAAFILHNEDESYCWEAFFEDALQLQHALVDKEGKLLFLTAMDRWWWLPGQNAPSSNTSPYHSIIRNANQELSIGSDRAALLQDMRDNKVFRVCAGFLDGIEEAVNVESNISFPLVAVGAQTDFLRIGELIEKIIRPLTQKKGIEAFQASLSDASSGILDGSLRSIREVEVVLVSTARWSSQSPEVFERFRDCLTSQCNTAIGLSERMWRNQYYVADLNDIMKISGELDRDQGIDWASRHWRDTSVVAVICPGGVSPGSPTLQSSKSTGVSTVGSSPTSSRTRITADTAQEDDVSTQMTSPVAASQASNSPTSPAFDSSTSHVERCDLCGQTFSGTPSDAKSNLNRHLRLPKHTIGAGARCPEPRCDAKPMRSDNLGPHLKRSHGLTTPQLEQAIKKSKGLSTVLEKA